MIVSVTDHGDQSTSAEDPIVSEDGITLFGNERHPGKLFQSDSITRVEANRISRSWTGARANPWLKWGIAVLTYILVILAAFFLSFREKYQTIVASTSWVRLDALDGEIQRPITSRVTFPMLLLLIDTMEGAGWDAYPSVFVTRGNIRADTLGHRQICDLSGSIRRKNVGNYDAYLLDLPSASSCGISVPSQYLRITTSYQAQTSGVCLLGAVFPPNTSTEVIFDTIMDDPTSSMLQYLSDGGQTLGIISRSTTVYPNGTASIDYGLSLQWVPSLYEGQSTSTSVTTDSLASSLSSQVPSSAKTIAMSLSEPLATRPGLVSSIMISHWITSTPTPAYRSVLRRSVPTKRSMSEYQRRGGNHGILDFSLQYESFLTPVTIQRRRMTRLDIFFHCLAFLGVLSLTVQVVDGVALWWNRRTLSKKERLD